MTRIDGATAARSQGFSQPSDQPLFDLLGPFNAEYFVEWQVADHDDLRVSGTRPEK
ncbi:MAG: hypothetical protein ACRD1D_01690 [Acidimicrobiales bacterium]